MTIATESTVLGASRAPRPFKEAPLAPGLPFFGSVLDAWRDPLKLLSKTARDLGDFVRFRFGPLDFVMLNDPAYAHHVLVTHQKNYAKSRSYDGMKLVLGRGLVTSEGPHWRKQRKLAQPAFHHQRLRGFAQTMARTTGELIESFPTRREVDLHQEMMRFTFRLVGLTLFGTDLGLEAGGIEPAFDVAIRFANAYVEQAVRIPLWVPTPQNLRFKAAMKTLDAFVYRLIEQRRASGKSGDDLLGMLLDATDETTSGKMSDGELRDEVMTLVLAGFETTANLLTWTLAELARNPDETARLRAEVETVLGDREPTFEDLPKLVHTERILHESMRLYPPAWCLEREAREDDEIAGFRVPKGTTIIISPYTLHRHPKHWEQPDAWNPMRFEERGAGQRPAYLPFGDGPRVCIGRAFAMMEAKIALAMLARDLDITLSSKAPIELDATITLRPKNAVPARISPRR